MKCFGSNEDVLYVILPYFNHCGFKRRSELFVQFVRRLRTTCGIRVIVSELVGSEPLPCLPVYRHLKFKSVHPLWMKENLVNKAAEQLPRGWKYMAWIDADISFLNRDWVRNTLDELHRFDIVQLFQTCVNLGSRKEAIKIDKSFGYMFKDSGTQWVPTDKYGFWHPGYAWACTRKAYVQMEGLIEWAILGSADRHMAYALMGRAEFSAPGNVHKNYKKLLRDFQRLCSGLTLSYIPGTILHHWHGSLADRKYRERWDILTSHKFDPLSDVQTHKGLVVLTRKGLRIQNDLIEYFVGRKEDS